MLKVTSQFTLTFVPSCVKGSTCFIQYILKLVGGWSSTVRLSLLKISCYVGLDMAMDTLTFPETRVDGSDLT